MYRAPFDPIQMKCFHPAKLSVKVITRELKKMEKLKALAVATALVSATSGWGASSYMFDNPENKAYFGARVALDISSAANGGGAYSNQAGFSIGAVYNIPLWTNLYFEPGLMAFYDTFGTSSWQTYKTDNILMDASGSQMVGDDGNPVYQEVGYQQDGSIRNFGFRIPLSVGFHFDFTEDIKVSVFTGPQFNFNLVARYHQNAVHVPAVRTESSNRSLFGTEGFKRLDFQWNFGAGITYQAYYMSLQGSWGITDMKSATAILPRDLQRNMFSITLGYNF